jgi:hypothetical protein
MTLHGQLRVLGAHALAVILHDDLVDSTTGDVNTDSARAGVDGVLHQFLDHRGRSLDDLAGADLLDGLEIKKMNATHGEIMRNE